MKKRIFALLLAVGMVLSVGCSSNDDSSQSNSQSEEQSAPQVNQRLENLQTAKEKNADAVAWLTVDGCEIDNVVFQGKDNDEYLRVNDEGKRDVWGCYFVDSDNVFADGETRDKAIIIYGHSLDDDPENKKFSKLKRYKNRDFAAEHPEIVFTTESETSHWQIFSACDVPITVSYIYPNPDAELHKSNLRFFKQYSYVDFGVDVTEDDQIMILSTCTSDESVRFVIAAKKVGI